MEKDEGASTGPAFSNACRKSDTLGWLIDHFYGDEMNIECSGHTGLRMRSPHVKTWGNRMRYRSVWFRSEIPGLDD